MDTGCSPEDLPEVMDERRIARELGKSMRVAQHDEIYIYILFCQCLEYADFIFSKRVSVI